MTQDPPRTEAEHEGRRCGPRRRRHRKEHVLHTRISEPLAEDIRRMAEDLRVPVSNLVRNVLEEAFSVVEAVTDNVGDLIEDVADEAERTRNRIRRRSFQTHRRRRHRFGPTNAHGRAADSVGRAPRAEFPELIGWQPLVLNQPRSCADCEEPIEPGERGFVGVASAGITEDYLCDDCMDARR